MKKNQPSKNCSWKLKSGNGHKSQENGQQLALAVNNNGFTKRVENRCEFLASLMPAEITAAASAG
jgi:hypothetical protein